MGAIASTAERMLRPARAARFSRRVDGLAAATACAAAANSGLLFLAQPLFARLALAQFGGGATFWALALAFAQGAVLVGYGYAHAIRRWSLTMQVALQSVLFAVVVATQPLKLDVRALAGDPSPTAFLLLAGASLGPGLVVLASTSVLLQRLLAHGRPLAGPASYSLFAAGSAGSVAGLLIHPFALEPLVDLPTEVAFWTVCFVALAGAVGLIGVVVIRERDGGASSEGEQRAATGGAEPPPAALVARWVGLSAAPSALMVGLTAYATADVAAVPLVWIAPLTAYLVTYIVAFAPRGNSGLSTGQAAALVAPAGLLLATRLAVPPLLALPVHLVGLFALGLGCHRRLAASRPAMEHASAYYLWIAAGGAAGGMAAGLAAPLVLHSASEYPAAMGLCWLLGYASFPRASDGARAVAAVRAGLALASAAMLLGALLISGERDAIHQERNLYGVNRVRRVVGAGEAGEYHVLVSGTTVHGIQQRDAGRRTEPLAYYHRGGPAAQIFEAVARGRPGAPVGVVGLGTGALACYGSPGQAWTFYELDPAVERIARDPALFTYLRDCPAVADVVPGDGRVSLAGAPDGGFALLVLDAYSSDSVPVHLLTREAVALYKRKLAPNGLIAFHISNRYIDLEPVLSGLGRDAGLLALVRADGSGAGTGDGVEGDSVSGAIASRWAVLGELPGPIGELAPDWRWRAARTDARVPVWSDSHTPLARLVRWW